MFFIDLISFLSIFSPEIKIPERALPVKSKSLVIVESPAKAKTTQNYLGDGFDVKASVGHIIDLPGRRLGIDIDNDFSPEYEVMPGKKNVVNDLKRSAKSYEKIYLAPDPDREGEAIAWHIAGLLEKQNKNIFRVRFLEVTKRAVLEAMDNPQTLDKALFESQQARRILDRIVGYQLSPLLWKKVKKGLSAGRVQSVAVRLVVDREKEILAFISEEYWELTVDLKTKESEMITAKLVDQKISSKEEMDKVLSGISKDSYIVENVEKKKRRQKPQAPYITSTMQQDSVNRLRFTAERTMRVAQSLYEGVDVAGRGRVGLITYMRTDSTRISDLAVNAVRKKIEQDFGKEYLPAKPRVYVKGNSKKAKTQDAHEAIRPSDVTLHPDKIKSSLNADQYKLYSLIYKRFLACQMEDAIFDQTSIRIDNQGYKFSVSGSVLRFDGFRKVLPTAAKEKDALPDIKKDEKLDELELHPEQKFTQPPPRFNESSLIKEMEERGIGRPSTYASIISTIQNKEYVLKEKEKFFPSELGFLVTDLLIENFPNIVDIGFTAKMEADLDRVEEGQIHYLNLLKRFYGKFKGALDKAQTDMKNVKALKESTGIDCPKCEAELFLRWGKNGKFLACSNFPDCKFTSAFEKDEKGKVSIKIEEQEEKECSKCDGAMVIKKGKTGGRFWGCRNYPDCKSTEPFSFDMPCPKEDCNTGMLVEKATRRGKIFCGCNLYPKCEFASWNEPLAESCDNCGAKTTFIKVTKKVATKICEVCNHKSKVEI